MAVFSERSELSRQKKHTPAQWDDSMYLKALGFNEQGKRSAWGRLAFSMAPGLNTGTQALAIGNARGDTKEVLKDTMDESIYKDFSGLAFGAQIAKSIVGAGAGSAAGGASSSGGGGLMSMFGGEGGGIMSMFGKGGGMTAAESAAGGIGGTAAEGGMMKNLGGNLLNQFKQGDTGTNDLGSTFQKISDSTRSEVIKNPFEQGTAEFDAFEQKMEQQRQKDIFGSGAKGASRWMSDVSGGNLFESGANFGTSLIAYDMAEKDAVKQRQSGQLSLDTSQNYLY